MGRVRWIGTTFIAPARGQNQRDGRIETATPSNQPVGVVAGTFSSSGTFVGTRALLPDLPIGKKIIQIFILYFGGSLACFLLA